MKLNSDNILYKRSLRFLLLLFVITFSSTLFSQTSTDKYCDSLQVLIKKTSSDTTKAKLCGLIMRKMLDVDMDKAFAIAKEGSKYALNSGVDAVIAKSYDGLGLCCEYRYEYNTAISFYSKALDIRLKSNDVVETASDCGNIGTVYLEMSDYPSAINFLLRSLKSIEENEKNFSNNKRLKYIKANALANIGLAYYSTQKYDKALEYDQKAVIIYTELNDTENAVSTLSTIANIYFDQKEFIRALALQRQALSMNSKLDNNIDMNGNLYTNMGNSFYNMNMLDSALYYDTQALKISEITKDERDLAIVYHNIGEIKFKQGKGSEGCEFINKSQVLALNSKTLELQRDNYKSLYEYYYSNKQYEKALYSFKSYVETRDSIFNEENTRKTVQAEMTYEFGKKEAIAKAEQESKDEIVKQEQQRERFVRNAFIAGFILVAVFGLFLFRGYRQKLKANQLLAEQKKEIEEQKTQIDDSIGYAKYIQRAILPSESDIVSSFKDIFGLYKPKDVVSGDFYWFAKRNEKILIAVADCTGHGVPGAFMSLIGSDKLNQVVQEKGITKPSDILSSINKNIKATLKQNEKNSVSRDGMDIALCSFDLAKLKMEYAGANRPLYLIRENQIIEYAPTKSAIAGLTDDNKEFENNSIDLKPGDKIYIFSDGFVDQFGGEKSKKYMTKRFKETLLDIHIKPMKEQEMVLDGIFNKWKGQLEQVDDILIIGIAV